MSTNSLADVRLRTLRHNLIRARRRAQMRYRAGQVVNAAIYILVSGIVATVLLSL